MAHAEICPVCEGSGSTDTKWVGNEEHRKCHGCNGKGWVEVSDTITQNDILGKAHIVEVVE